MVSVISWEFTVAELEPAAEAWAWTWARACVKLELLKVNVISWPVLPVDTRPELPMTWLKSWEPVLSTESINTTHATGCYVLRGFSKLMFSHIPAASCSERLAIVTWAGVMVEGCRAKLVKGWMTTLADDEGSVLDISWLPEWEMRAESTLRGCERRPPCCNVCWRRVGSIWKRAQSFRTKLKIKEGDNYELVGHH